MTFIRNDSALPMLKGLCARCTSRLTIDSATCRTGHWRSVSGRASWIAGPAFLRSIQSNLPVRSYELATLRLPARSEAPSARFARPRVWRRRCSIRRR